ncbi:hypothetical protein CWI37_0290p0030 [Hamiltosporidium tvaerminnensis]|uniref:Uncharacterized protein n=1 Tax=Hamiltosporidium tvaerminnensis TaxID=1176355 RepID=A0A4Q9L722_9MICR|nr:hypothetical protein CWI37_0290p0030 [Hamiltosporidium tvaerminnensis]
MSEEFYLSNSKKLFVRKLSRYIFIIFIGFFWSVYSTSVSFFVINEENCITDSNIDNSILEATESENYSVECIYEQEEIKVLKNNTICSESTPNQFKYYNPNIFTMPYRKNMLLNSNFLKTAFESKQTNIRIFFRDISYNALLLFFKLIDKSDIIVNQIKIQDFLDILLILSVLDIERTKESNHFIKELFSNFIFEMQNSNHVFDPQKYYNSYHYKYIKKSILIELYIILIDLISFNDKIGHRYTVHHETIASNFKKTITAYSFNSIHAKSLTSKIYLRLNNISISSLHKIINSEYLMNTWIFLLNITKMDLIYFIFSDDETYNKAIQLFSNITLHAEKLYIHFFEEPMKFFINKNINFFSENLKVLKLRYNFTTEELKNILRFCNRIERLTIKTYYIDFERLSLLVNFSMNNPNISCKILGFVYELPDIDYEFINNIPRNILFYLENSNRNLEYEKIPAKYMPFFQNYYFHYKQILNSRITIKPELLEFSRVKSVTLDFESNSSPYKIETSVFNMLRCFKTIKYFSLQNIVISNELLLYVLESDTLQILTITKFICIDKFRYISENETLFNRKLVYILLFDSLTEINPSIFIYLSRFKNVSGFNFTIINENRTSFLKKIINHFFGTANKKYTKTYLNCLRIETNLNYIKKINFLEFFSELYDFSKLCKIVYHVYEIGDIEYSIISKMTSLKFISIGIYNSKECINYEKLFNNHELFNTIEYVGIYVSQIRKRDIDILKNNKNLKTLRISCEIIDYDTILGIKKNDFKNTMIIFERPVRAKRSVEINNYLDSEFQINFP